MLPMYFYMSAVRARAVYRRVRSCNTNNFFFISFFPFSFRSAPAKPKVVAETTATPVYSAPVASSKSPTSLTSSNKFSSKPTSYPSSSVSATAMASSRSPTAYSSPHNKSPSYEETKKKYVSVHKLQLRIPNPKTSKLRKFFSIMNESVL